MANVLLNYGPYNSKADSKREYDATDIGKMFDGIITDGVFPYIGERFRISKSDGLNINVNPGSAWFNHTWNRLDNPMPFKLKNGDASYNRYDAVILRIGCSELVRENEILIRSGTPSENPVPPALEIDTDAKYEYALGYILVPTNANEIASDTQITNLVGADADPLGFYKPGEFAEFAYAIGNNNIGVKRVTVPKDDNAWVPMTGSDGSEYFKRTNILCPGITNNAILSMDLWTEGDNILNIQKQENAYSYIYRYEVRDGYLTLWSYYKPDVEFTVKFVGTGVNNI